MGSLKMLWLTAVLSTHELGTVETKFWESRTSGACQSLVTVILLKKGYFLLPFV